MKKYFSFLLIFSLLLFLGYSVSSAQTPSHNCQPGQRYDTFTGTPCSSIAVCLPGIAINHITGASCTGGSSVGVNTKDAPHDYYADYLAITLKTVRRGASNSIDAAYLQAFLIENNLLDQKYLTTYYGPLTSGAVKEFQKNAKLKQDGLYGPQTLKAVQEVIKRNPSIARNIATRAKTAVKTKTSPTTITPIIIPNRPPTDFSKGIDLTKESAWGTPVRFYEDGKGYVYVRDFGLDPYNGALNTVTTFVDRVPGT